MIDSGWIKIHRSILDHWIYTNEIYLRVWIHILFRANFKDTKVMFNNKLVPVARGEFITSINKFSEELNITIRTTRTIWALLENDEMISKKSTHRMTRITVCNYDEYQKVPTNSSTQRRQSGDKAATTEKERKEGEEGKFNTLPDPSESGGVKKKNRKTMSPETIRKNEECMEFSRFLARIIQSQKNIDITPEKKKAWSNEIRKLVFDSEKVGKQRVRAALNWYWKNVGGEFVPVIESGRSFRDKFVKLEAAMVRESDHGYKRRHGTREESGYDDPETTEMSIRK